MDKYPDLKSGLKKVLLLCVGLLVGIYILYRLYLSWGDILSLLTPFLIALFITYILNPVVNFLEDRKIPRIVGILLIYAFFFGIIALIIFSLLPSLVSELRLLGEQLPGYAQRVQELINEAQAQYRRFNLPSSIKDIFENNLQSIQSRLGEFLQGLANSLVNAFGHLFTAILVPILAFYFLRDTEKIKQQFITMVPSRYRKKVMDLAEESDKTLGSYLRGILIVSFAVGVMVYIGLLILGVDFALLMALLSGMTNIIPYFGPFLGAIPVVLIALLQNPSLAWKVIVMLVIVQQVESQLISPFVLSKSLGLHPLLVILAILAGGRFFGFWGLILAVPLTAIMAAIVTQIGRERPSPTQDGS